MTDQARIANICSSAADEVARSIAATSGPAMVTVTVTGPYGGQTIAEGYADTADYLPRTPDERDPDT